MGIAHTSGTYFGKKLPENPKKPNRIGFRLSSLDSEQGCRTAALFCVRRTQSGTAAAPRTRRAPPHPPPYSPAPFYTLAALTSPRARIHPSPR